MTGLTPMTSKNSRDTLLPGIIEVSLPILTGAGPGDISAMARNARVPRFQSSKLGSDAAPIRRPLASI